jgi:hypothetical protein
LERAERGNSAYQADYLGDYIGYCDESVFRLEDKDSGDRDPDASRAFDCATVRISDAYTNSKFAADYDDSDGSNGEYKVNWRIDGAKGWDRIKDGYGFLHQGVTTGTVLGNVTVTFTNHTFETDANLADGDSGAPVFEENYYSDGTSYKGIAGVYSYGASGGNAGAIWAGKAENEFNLSI